MTHDPKPPRQPLFWAAVHFRSGYGGGASVRPPLWWVIAVAVFVSRRHGSCGTRVLAKALSLGAWVLLGALLIQVRGQRPDEPSQDGARLFALADGRPVVPLRV